MQKTLARTERLLWLGGGLALAFCFLQWGRAEVAQMTGRWVLEHRSENSARTVSFVEAPEGSLMAGIDIPRLDLHAIVFEGTSDGTLAEGVGHLKGSAYPGAPGNLVLAGHRDSFFRPLKNIRVGDVVRIWAPGGEFDYAVDSTAIVDPTDVEVLQPGQGENLTLITCYPFRYAGSAPQRFIVRAKRVRAL